MIFFVRHSWTFESSDSDDEIFDLPTDFAAFSWEGPVPASAHVLSDEYEIDCGFRMPDFYELQSSRFMVSSRFRTFVEDLAPGCLEYIPLRLRVAERMQPAGSYYFINILARSQRLDWARMKPVHHGMPVARGKKQFNAPISLRDWRFKPTPTDEHPMIWQESSYETAEGIYFPDNRGFYATEHFQLAVEREFPNQVEWLDLTTGLPKL